VAPTPHELGVAGSTQTQSNGVELGRPFSLCISGSQIYVICGCSFRELGQLAAGFA
jgi:hypothetical protein